MTDYGTALCPICETPFEKHRWNQICCSQICRKEHLRQYHIQRWHDPKIKEKLKEYKKNYYSQPYVKEKLRQNMKRFYDREHALPEDPRDTRLDRFIYRISENDGILGIEDTRLTSSLEMLNKIGAVSVEDDAIKLNPQSPYLAALDGWFEEAEKKYYDPNFERPFEWKRPEK